MVESARRATTPRGWRPRLPGRASVVVVISSITSTTSPASLAALPLPNIVNIPIADLFLFLPFIGFFSSFLGVNLRDSVSQVFMNVFASYSDLFLDQF